MKKCYTLILLSLVVSTLSFSQNRFWVGPTSGAGGLWSNSANWSASSGGAGGASVPNGGGFNVVFDQNAVVNLDLVGLTLNSIRVMSSSRATIYTTIATDITVNSSTIGAEALVVDAGSTLIDSTSSTFDFGFFFNNNARGIINGNWEFGASSTGTAFFDAASSGVVASFNNNSACVFRNGGGGDGTASTLSFQNGALMLVDRNGGFTPTATYATNSTIRINGNTSAVTNIQGFPPDLGNVEYDCAGLTATPASLGLPNATNIKGNFRVLNTNNRVLILISNVTGTPTITVGGNFELSPNARVVIGNSLFASNLQVNGNFVQTGGIFSIQDANGTSTTTTMRLRGNFSQSAGIFTSTSTATSNSSNLFVLEMNGTTTQTISAVTGTIDNSNHQVALRINNANHLTLNSPLAVGRVNFVNGRINTTVANALTISNTGNNLIDISGASASSYVEGPLKRLTAATTAYVFPVGKGGSYRICEVIPSTAAASEYMAEYFNTGHSDLSVIMPLTGVANDRYWDITRISGSAAAVRLTLNGAVPNATAGDALVVARYNGSDWVQEKGSTGTGIVPGNATSGTATSQSLASFSPFTFGYGPAASLPIKLQYFTAQKGNGFNTLNWKADCYSTQAVFHIERSLDGRQFNKIETVIADQQRCLQPFDFRDNTAGQGTVYYRMSVVDVDGTAYYSRVVALVGKNSGFEIVGIYPTIVTNSQLKVNIASGNSSNAEFYISGSSGQILKRFKFTLVNGDNIITLNIPELAAGVYQLTGFNSDGQVRTFRFVKQ